MSQISIHTFTVRSHDCHIDRAIFELGGDLALRSMRYGIVREAEFLPSVEEQRRTLARWTCDLVIEEDGSVESTHRIDQFLLRANAGDEVVVQDLSVFLMRTGKLARFLRDLLEIDVSVVVPAADMEATRLDPGETVISALTLLAVHDSREPPSSSPRRRASEELKRLSSHQIRYVRKLHKEGESLRAIGQLFRLSPREVSEILAR